MALEWQRLCTRSIDDMLHNTIDDWDDFDDSVKEKLVRALIGTAKLREYVKNEKIESRKVAD